MTEFLTENARRAYPLERGWPDGMDAWSRMIVDASVATNDILEDDRLSLLSVAREGSVLTFTVGVPGTTGIPVTFDRAAWTGGRTAVAYGYGSESGDLPPYKKRVEYLESNGTQYINTDVLVSSNLSIKMDMSFDARYCWACGGRTAYHNSAYGFWLDNSSNLIAAYGNTDVTFAFDYKRHQIDMLQNSLYIDEVLKRTFTQQTFSSQAHICLFNIFVDTSDGISNIGLKGKVYSCEIYEGVTLVRDFIPVLDWDDKPKMFDLVTQSYPAHYGDFVAGPVTEPAKLRGASQVKALLTLNVEAVDALLADLNETGGDVGVPFAMRCSGGAVRHVTSITAQGTAACTTPVYDPDDATGRTEVSVGSNEHAVIKAGDGVDLEVTGVTPLVGDVLRVSAIAAPEATEEQEDPIDMMIRGDACFTVEAIPGAKVSGNAIVPRTASDRSGGVVRIGTVCKPCCQCEDYKDAVDLLRPAETGAWLANETLDGIEAAYRQALAVFAAAKTAAEAVVNSAAGVRATATAALSGGIYGQSTVAGTRQRISVTLLVENMTMRDVGVSVGNDGTNSGFTGFSGWTHLKTMWTKGGATQENGLGRPGSRTLKPGETLTVVATYCKANTETNVAERPSGLKAYCTVTVGSATTTKEVDVR